MSLKLSVKLLIFSADFVTDFPDLLKEERGESYSEIKPDVSGENGRRRLRGKGGDPRAGELQGGEFRGVSYSVLVTEPRGES